MASRPSLAAAYTTVIEQAFHSTLVVQGNNNNNNNPLDQTDRVFANPQSFFSQS